METPDIQLEYFRNLIKDREESAATLEKPSMKGIKKTITEKYSDQAHFIYELLQNADDAKATKARFYLDFKGLSFVHNGTVQFTVSNPENEEMDTIDKKLGHVNSITSIANSNKNEATIGKFGVGFKAVFQYSDTPHIFTDNFCFKIENYIVPKLLPDDHSSRKKFETFFYFPFDKDNYDEDPYTEIQNKLKTLIYPVLFLNNLQDFQWECDGERGAYEKKILETRVFEKCQLEYLDIKNGNSKTQSILLFSKFLDGGHKISVAFELDETLKLKQSNYDAFCFFPTKESTKLNFIIHAPFLLTASREGILAGNKWNIHLIKELAVLAGDSFVLLKQIGIENEVNIIDDEIFNIIPYKLSDFNQHHNSNKISFLPFYDEIYHIFKTEEILPGREGKYTTKEFAYWASDTDLVDLFSDQQLSELLNIENANWVFTLKGRKRVESIDKELLNYIDGGNEREKREPNLIKAYLDPEKTLKLIDSTFIQNQSDDWLNKFYLYLNERVSYQEHVRTKPIFINDRNEAVSAFDTYGNLILFLFEEYKSEYPTIHKRFFAYPGTIDFFKKFGIKPPNTKDEIINIILPKYFKGDMSYVEAGFKSHFQKIFYYTFNCPLPERESLIENLKNCPFFLCKSKEKGNNYFLSLPYECYISTKALREYFDTKHDTAFIVQDYYLSINNDKHGSIDKLLTETGVNTLPRIIHDKSSLSSFQLCEYLNIEQSDLSYKYLGENYIISKTFDGLEETFAEIDKSKSILIWNLILQKINEIGFNIFKSELQDKLVYYLKSQRQATTKYIDSDSLKLLKTQKWLFVKNGENVSPNEITLDEIDEGYDKSSLDVKDFADFIGFKSINEKPDMPAEDYRAYELGARLLKYGIIEEDIPELMSIFEQRKSKTEPLKENKRTGEENLETNLDKVLNSIKESIKDRQNQSNISNINIVPIPQGEEIEDEQDEDEYIKPVKDYSRKIKQFQSKAQNEIDKMIKIEELLAQVKNYEKYSYIWLMSLLELEYLNSNEADGKSKELSIQFSKVELDKGTNKTIILKDPNFTIPGNIEDIGELTVKLNFEKEYKTISIEVVSVKEHSLKAKLRSEKDAKDIDFSSVTSAVIDIKNPSFILDELIKKLKDMEIEDDFNLKSNLTKDIKFIFGPPGTGKTTYLAKDILIPLMNRPEKYKVLVLTPTNKAADVLVSKILEQYQDDNSYEKWLVRFGITGDPEIEESVIMKKRDFDIKSLRRNVVVTTIARFPYDYFQPEGEIRKNHLRELKWDYIVIDEASMIPLASIIYPLYNNPGSKFIIAGDPFQIQPITALKEWKDENIYTMVELNKFSAPTTVPHAFEVINLTTQYRSIPSIANIFSKFTYDGILKHFRDESTQRKLNLGEYEIKSLNIITFPVNKSNTLFKSKRLRKTPFHIYSAIFTYEFGKFIAKKIHENNTEHFKLGIICPYRAQADIIHKLFDKMPFISDKCDIQVGTIHGFQGDECDLIISLFNPPPDISNSPEMFLNKQNILNVSISRAKDYLFILMPDSNTDLVYNLKLINRIVYLIRSKEEDNYTVRHSTELEKIMFNKENYIEDNSFVTTHQLINFYSDSEKLYEVRSEENAIDIQIDKNYVERTTFDFERIRNFIMNKI